MSAREIETKQARRLLDILNYSKKAVSFIGGVEVIGEAARHLTPETAAEVGGLPLEKMRGMRNLISHDYHRIRPEDVFMTARVHLPLLIQQIEPHKRDLCFAAKLEIPPE